MYDLHKLLPKDLDLLKEPGNKHKVIFPRRGFTHGEHQKNTLSKTRMNIY